MPESKNLPPVFMIQVGDSFTGGGVTPQMSVEEFVQGTNEKLQNVARVVVEAIGPFFSNLDKVEAKPSECALEFGVNVGGEAGVPWVTKGTIGANFKVTLKWSWAAPK